jgi:hypothetical protein
MTAEGIRAVLQGMRMRGELKKPGLTPYLSPSETLVVMGRRKLGQSHYEQYRSHCSTFPGAQDATTTHAVINAMKKAKSTKVSVSQDEHGVRFGRNGQPSTTGGLYVNETVMSAIKAKNLFEVQQEFEQGQRAELRASKSVTKLAEETTIAAAVKVAMAGNVVGTAFKIPGFKAPEIVIAANVLTSATPKVTTKAAALSALETFWLHQTTYSAA